MRACAVDRLVAAGLSIVTLVALMTAASPPVEAQASTGCVGGSLAGRETNNSLVSGAYSTQLFVPANATVRVQGTVRNIQSIFGAQMPWRLTPFTSGTTPNGQSSNVDLSWTNGSTDQFVTVEFHEDGLFAFDHSWDVTFSGAWACQGLSPVALRNTLGQQHDNGEAGDPVNTGSGNFFDTTIDVPAVGSLGSPLVARTYNSMDPGLVVDAATGQTGIFGSGWTSWLDAALWPSGPDELIYREPTGRQVDVTDSGNGTWILPIEERATITETTNGYTLEHFDGRVMEFDLEGRITSMGDGAGTVSTVIRDAVTGVPEEVTVTHAGQPSSTMELTDLGDDGLIDAVEGPGGIRRSYTYIGSQLTAVSVPHLQGQPAPVEESYEWSPGGQIEAILTHIDDGIDPVERVRNAYDSSGRVEVQDHPDGDVTTFDYAEPDALDQRRTTVTYSGAGTDETYVYIHDAGGRILGIEDPYANTATVAWADRLMSTSSTRGGAITDYTHDAAGRLTDVALPDPDAPTQSDRSEEATYCDPTGSDPRPLTVTDAAGTVTEYAYGAPTDSGYPCAGTDRVPTSVTEAAGTAVEATTTIDVTDGLPTEVTDPDGVSTRYRWDVGRALILAQEQDPDPSTPGTETTFFAYDVAGRLLVERTPTGIETWYTYDASGRKTSRIGPLQAPSRGCAALTDTCLFPSTPPSGPTETFAYWRDGSLASHTDAEGDTWTYTRSYPALGGRIETEERPDGSVLEVRYDAAGRAVAETEGDPAIPAELATTTYTYGPLGRLASVTGPTGVEVRYGYDADGNITEVIDADDELTETTYDAAGRVRSTSDPLGRTTTYEYGLTGLLTEQTDRTDATTTYAYDARGRLTTTTDARGGITTHAYTAAGRPASITDATNRTTTYDYDNAGREVTETSPSGAENTTAYDADGRVASETTPEGRTTTYTYDPAGRRLTVADPARGTTTWTYDNRGDVLTETDATGGTITYTRDELGRPVTVTDPLGRTTTYEYDSRGNRTKRIDALGGERKWQWNLADQIVAEIDPLGRETTYAYDALGRLDVKTDGAGRTFDHGYDAAGRLTSIDYAAGTPTTFQYDGEGRRTQMVDATGTSNWSYNLTGQMTGANLPGDRDLAFAWDAAGRRTVIRYPDQTRYRNRYDTDGRLSGVQREDGSAWVDVAVNTYDDDGLLVEQDQGSAGERTWAYDAVTGRMTGYTETRGGSTTATTLTHDAAGRVATDSTGGVATIYDYDDAGQLVSVDRSVGDDETYAYDELGRRTTSTNGGVTTTYEWDAASQLTRRVVGGVNHNYQYDASGRRTREGWNGGTHYVQWFWGDRGTSTGQRFTEPGTVTGISTSTRGDGTLASYTTQVNGVLTETTNVVWDPTMPAPQPVWTGEPGTTNSTRAVYGPDLIQVECTTGTSCTGPIEHDVYGSALETTATADVTQAPSYDAWGDGGPFATGTNYGYRSELHTGNTIHLRARDYDPATGLFTSPDPLDGVDGTTTVSNPYHYTDNDPINSVDPSGLRPTECAPNSPFDHLSNGNPSAGFFERDRAEHVLARRSIIERWAGANGISSLLLAVLVHHEGGNYLDPWRRTPAEAADHAKLNYAQQRGGAPSVGIAGIQTGTAQEVLTGRYCEDDDLTAFEVGEWLIASDEVSIAVAAGYLRMLQDEYPTAGRKGLFIAYSASETSNRIMEHFDWDVKDMARAAAVDLYMTDRFRVTVDGEVLSMSQGTVETLARRERHWHSSRRAMLRAGW